MQTDDLDDVVFVLILAERMICVLMAFVLVLHLVAGAQDGPVGQLEDAASGRGVLVQVGAHADALRSLTREQQRGRGRHLAYDRGVRALTSTTWRPR